MRDIMKDAGGDGATMKLAKRKLDTLGITIKAHSCVANDPKRLKRLQSALELSASLAEVSRIKSNDRATKKTTTMNELHDLAMPSLLKLRAKDDNPNELTKEICALALRFFGSTLIDSKSKPSLVSALTALMDERPRLLAEVDFDDKPPLPNYKNEVDDGDVDSIIIYTMNVIP